MGFYTGTHNVKFRLSSRRKVRIAYNKRFVQSCVKTRKPVISKKRVLLFRRKKMYAITSSVKPQNTRQYQLGILATYKGQ